jgi:hypothetical protein
VCGLRPVVETVGAMAGVAAEREEVELVAVGVLAVCADGLEIGGVEHGECFVGGVGSRHVGRCVADIVYEGI